MFALSGHPEFLSLIARSRADFAAGRSVLLHELRKAAAPRKKFRKRSAQ
jgi:hypothetical protein